MKTTIKSIYTWTVSLKLQADSVSTTFLHLDVFVAATPPIEWLSIGPFAPSDGQAAIRQIHCWTRISTSAPQDHWMRL